MSMALTQLEHTMGTVTCSWTGSMSTTMKPQVNLYDLNPYLCDLALQFCFCF